jgi:hypothetical protein
MKAWMVAWTRDNRVDGRTRALLWTPPFHTRREAREYINDRYGYIRKRPDLRAEPHGWHMPEAVRVEVREVK